MREQLLTLLAQGATRDEAIKVVGCSEDLITELLKDKVFLQELTERRNEHRQEIIEASYARLEQNTLTKINKELEFADVPSLCRILETTAKNRLLHKNPAGHFQTPNTHLTVEIKLPQGASAEKITIDHKTNQIVAIGDRSMAAMPIAGVHKVFKQLETQRQEVLTSTQEREIIDADINEGEKEVNHEHHYEEQTAEARSVARAA